MDEKMVEIAFQLISHGGNARGMAMEAINAAKQNNIEIQKGEHQHDIKTS